MHSSDYYGSYYFSRTIILRAAQMDIHRFVQRTHVFVPNLRATCNYDDTTLRSIEV